MRYKRKKGKKKQKQENHCEVSKTFRGEMFESDSVSSEDQDNRDGVTEAQFKRRTFHVPNLIPLIKYMKRSTFESIKFNMCNLGRPKN